MSGFPFYDGVLGKPSQADTTHHENALTMNGLGVLTRLDRLARRLFIDPLRGVVFSRGTAVPSAHCVSTIDGVILSVDANFLLLVERSEAGIIGISYKDITDPRDLDRSAGMLKSLVPKAPPVRLQKRYIRPDGAVVHANVLTTRFTNPDRLVSTLYWSDADRPLPPVALWETALGIRHVQNVRRVEFGPELFHDGVDAIILELYLAEAEGRIITVAELVQTGPVPAPITLRWIKHLNSVGIITSTCALKSDVSFTNSGIAKMERMLGSVAHLPDAVSKLN